MAIARFYAPDLQIAGSNPEATLSLSESESQHASKVLRMKVGEPIELFDGKGYVAAGTIIQIAPKKVQVRPSAPRQDPRVLPGWIKMAVAMPKGDRQRAIIERVVEFGVHELQPIHTDRCVADVDEGARRRLDRYSLEAAKQCGRNLELTILPSQPWNRFVQEETSQFRWVAHPYPTHQATKETTSRSLGKGNESGSKDVSLCFAIGPEGGFTEKEVESAWVCGWTRLGMGSRILRTESAVAFAAVFGSLCMKESNCHWGNLDRSLLGDRSD